MLMNNSDLNFNNIRHVSVRKKTASRICSAQVLYEETFLETNINLIESFSKNSFFKLHNLWST